MDNYEDHLDQIEEEAYARKYAQKMVESCISGIVDELAENLGMPQREVIKKQAGAIKKILLSMQILTDSGLLAKKGGVDLPYSIEALSCKLNDTVPPREAKELKWIEETLANPDASDRQIDEASAVEQAIEDVDKIGTETESPELIELYQSGRQAAKKTPFSG